MEGQGDEVSRLVKRMAGVVSWLKTGLCVDRCHLVGLYMG